MKSMVLNFKNIGDIKMLYRIWLQYIYQHKYDVGENTSLELFIDSIFMRVAYNNSRKISDNSFNVVVSDALELYNKPINNSIVFELFNITENAKALSKVDSEMLSKLDYILIPNNSISLLYNNCIYTYKDLFIFILSKLKNNEFIYNRYINENDFETYVYEYKNYGISKYVKQLQDSIFKLINGDNTNNINLSSIFNSIFAEKYIISVKEKMGLLEYITVNNIFNKSWFNFRYNLTATNQEDNKEYIVAIRVAHNYNSASALDINIYDESNKIVIDKFTSSLYSLKQSFNY